MMNTMNFANNTVTVVYVIGGAFEKKWNEWERERKEYEEEYGVLDRVREWLNTHTPEDEGWEEEYSFYSDIHKDIYGFRPRW